MKLGEVEDPDFHGKTLLLLIVPEPLLLEEGLLYLQRVHAYQRIREDAELDLAVSRPEIPLCVLHGPRELNHSRLEVLAHGQRARLDQIWDDVLYVG